MSYEQLVETLLLEISHASNLPVFYQNEIDETVLSFPCFVLHQTDVEDEEVEQYFGGSVISYNFVLWLMDRSAAKDTPSDLVEVKHTVFDALGTLSDIDNVFDVRVQYGKNVSNPPVGIKEGAKGKAYNSVRAVIFISCLATR